MKTESQDIITQMFSIYDSSKWDDLYGIFTSDIVYCRPGQKMLQGIEDVVTFFKTDRPVASGKHTIHKIFSVRDNLYCVLGWFTGKLKNGSTFDAGFVDLLGFQGHKINLRKTYLDNQTEDQLGNDLLNLINS